MDNETQTAWVQLEGVNGRSGTDQTDGAAERMHAQKQPTNHRVMGVALRRWSNAILRVSY